jgi:hypothetical protein
MSRPFVDTAPYDVVPTVQVTPARAAIVAPAHTLRRFAGWLSALVADDGVGARFAAERERDQGLVRRVEQGRP